MTYISLQADVGLKRVCWTASSLSFLPILHHTHHLNHRHLANNSKAMREPNYCDMMSSSHYKIWTVERVIHPFGRNFLARTTSTLSANSGPNTFQETVVSWTKRITHCSKSGDIDKALHLFVKMPHRNQASWNAILTALLESNQVDFARKVFEEMPYKNSVSYTSMISGLSRLGFVSEARAVFDLIKVSVSGCNVISWTAMISCYSKNGLHSDALKLFIDCYGDFFALNVMPNSYTFSNVLKSCLQVGSLVIAAQIRGLIVKLLDEDDEKGLYVQNALIDLYSKLGSLVDAEKIFNGMQWKDLSTWNIIMASYMRHLMFDNAIQIFNSMQEKDTLSWNILISGCAESGRGLEALESFIRLWKLSGQDIRPNPSTFSIILSACATFCMLESGKLIHACTVKCGLYGNHVFINNSLIHMYARCGFIEESERAFDELQVRDIVSWNSLILGLGQNGYCRRAIEVAEKALEFGFYNHNTFIGVLTSCSHGGLVDEGLKYFSSMSAKFGVQPSLDHYICVIDMLGRAGRVAEAYKLLHRMPFEPNSVAWTTLLNACMLHNNEEVGEIAAKKLKNLEPDNVNIYVMLANLYGRSGKTEEYKRVLCLMNDVGLKKDQCRSFIV